MNRFAMLAVLMGLVAFCTAVHAETLVTAGGATCWELCSLGVPQVVVALESNQQPNADGIAATGCGLSIGEYAANRSPGQAAAAVESLLADARLRARMSTRARSLVDGRGVDRAVESLLEVVDARCWSRMRVRTARQASGNSAEYART